MKNKRTFAAAGALATLGLLAPAAPSMARAATVTVEWEVEGSDPRGGDVTCVNPTITSDKDISNLVYVLASGEEIRIEFSDDEQSTEYTVDGEVVEIWVKSGNNKSGDGSGLGQHFVPDPMVCTGGGGGGGGGGDA